MWFLFFVIACLYCLLHFVWESILAPSLRLNLRFELFALRDKLRNLKLSQPNLTDEAFRSVEDGIHSSLRILYDIDIPLLLHCDALVKKDIKLQERIAKRRALVVEANCPELNEIIVSVRKKVEAAACFNSGGWFLYLVPIAFVVFCFRRMFSPIVSLLYIPQSELERFVPHRQLEGCPA
jgi:hypothetical protein